jgi:hypothetical protein
MVLQNRNARISTEVSDVTYVVPSPLVKKRKIVERTEFQNPVLKKRQ